jgi:glutamyl-tRNA reductase
MHLSLSASPQFPQPKGGRYFAKIGVIGLNFKTADLSFREQIANGAASLSGERARFFLHPTVLLSTCNRTEIYFSAEDLSRAHGDLLAFLRMQIAVPFEHRLYSYFGVDCFTHLCRVTAGLDSAILAESEIQRQVKTSYAASARCLQLPAPLHYAFQKALKIGKAVRTCFPQTCAQPTLARTIWGLMREGPWPRQILFVGNSELNRQMIRYFHQKHVGAMTLATREPGAVQVPGCFVASRSILAEWPRFDAIICASTASGYLIQGGSDRFHWLFDLSVPRTVDPNLCAPLAAHYNIEEINRIILARQSGHRSELKAGEQLVREHVQKLYQF